MKGVLKLEVEKLHITLVDADYISEGGGRIIDSNDIGDRFTETSLRKHHNHDILGNGSLKFIGTNRINIHRNVLTPSGEDHLNFSDDVSSILSAVYQYLICCLSLSLILFLFVPRKFSTIFSLTFLKSIMFVNWRCYFPSIVLSYFL